MSNRSTMLWLIIASVIMVALTACKPKEDTGHNPYAKPLKGEHYVEKDDGPSITMVGPRLGFDGKIKLGCCSPGFGF